MRAAQPQRIRCCQPFKLTLEKAKIVVFVVSVFVDIRESPFYKFIMRAFGKLRLAARGSAIYSAKLAIFTYRSDLMSVRSAAATSVARAVR
jgi:hypothetical protein